MTRELIIKIYIDKIYLTKQHYFSLSDTNLGGKLLFTSRSEIYFRVRATISGNETLIISVLNYNEVSINEFETQNFELSVRFLTFEKLDWNLLQPLLSSYQKNKLQPLCTNLELPKPDNEWKNNTKAFSKEKYTRPVSTTGLETTESFAKAFDEITFYDGYVSFEQSIAGHSEPYTIKIENPELRQEFNYIKYYFEKHFKTKKINVTATMSFMDSGVSVTAVSPEIAEINSGVIESVKTNRTLLLKNIDYTPEIGKTILDEDELFELLDKSNTERNIFEQTPEDIINTLINQNGIRNKEQLKYLSKEIQLHNEKIRFTLKPIFGFLFSAQGNVKKHYVWELLNTNATYIWSLDEHLGFNLVENELNVIRQIGRQKYRALDKNELENNGLEFNLVFHKVKSVEVGFEIWKGN